MVCDGTRDGSPVLPLSLGSCHGMGLFPITLLSPAQLVCGYPRDPGSLPQIAKPLVATVWRVDRWRDGWMDDTSPHPVQGIPCSVVRPKRTSLRMAQELCPHEGTEPCP